MCCLAFALFLANINLVLLMKVLLIKKVSIFALIVKQVPEDNWGKAMNDNNTSLWI